MKKVPTMLGTAAIEAERPEERTPPARATDESAGFLVENGLALGLLGLGAGWMALLAARQGRDFVAEHPLTTGALAVATGVGVALALPETRIENRTMGPVARSLADQARGLADHVRADVRRAGRAVTALRDAVSPVTDDGDTVTQ